MRRVLQNKRFRIAVLIVVMGCLSVISYFGMSTAPGASHDIFNDPFDDRTFDQTVWLQQRNASTRDNPRGLMAHDLATLIETKHLTRAEVIALLGEPDARSSEEVFSYHIGMWSGFRMDDDTFDVHFDSSGHVDDAKVIQH
jgi:hypothetical protein